MPPATPSPPLDPFLTGVNINSTSSAWTQILSTTGPLKLSRATPIAPQNIALKSDLLFGLTFDSTATVNVPKFGASPSSTTNAAVSATSGDAVLGLVAPATPFSVPFRDIRTAFFGSATLPSQLMSFITAIDPANSMNLVLDGVNSNRSALWAASAQSYYTVAVLVFDTPTASSDNIKTFINGAFGIAMQLLNPTTRITFKLAIAYSPNPANPSQLLNTSTYAMDISLEGDGLELVAHFSPDGLNFILSNAPSPAPSTASVYDRLSGSIIGPSPSASTPKSGDIPKPGGSGAFNSIFSAVHLWYLSLQPSMDRTALPDGSGEETAGDIYWQIDMIVKWHSNVDVVLGLQYDSRLERFNGRLLFKGDDVPQFANRRYDYNPQYDVANVLSTPLPEYVDLWQLFSPNAKAPGQIPSKMIHGSTSFAKTGTDGYIFTIAATIVSDASFHPSAKKAAAAPDGFKWDIVSVAAVIQSPAAPAVSLELFSEFSLHPPAGSKFSPATFAIDIAWNSTGSWILHGSIGDLSLGLLVDFFSDSVKGSALGLIGSLEIQTLDIVYTYNGDGDASSFYIEGVIVLGDLELDLIYEYASGLLDDGVDSASTIAKKESGDTTNTDPPLLGPLVGGVRQSIWVFSASLGAASPGSNIASIMNSISPNAGKLPDFIGKIPVGEVEGPTSAVRLILRGEGSYTALSIAITIGDFSITFVSLTTPSAPDPKRILRLEADQIPLVKSIPLIKDLPQPFDKLLYLWLDDESGKGLLKAELDNINDELDFLQIPRVLTKNNNDADPSLPVLLPDHHFMVINKGVVILDHRFGDDDAKSTPTTPTATPAATLAVTPATGADQSDGPTKGGLEVQLPFLTISGISLDYKQGSILLSFDATILLGPLLFAILGFYIGVPLSSIQLNDLSKIQVDFGLHGLAADVDIPPVYLAGVFIHDGIVTSNGMQLDTFRGGLSLGFEAWKFIAVGEYANSVDGKFKSVFVYAKLDGPLFSLAFATVEGVRVGLGYNSVVRSPSIKELPQFPFLDDSADANTGQDPLALIQAITNPPSGQPWVAPKEDSYWIAAGMTLTAFGILSVTAVLMFGVRDGGFVISIFADGIAQIPCDVEPEATLFYVEIGMLAELNTVDGYFTVQAALAPSSHILVPSCRLTGGFALVNWFAPSPHSGDFVFTVGGYHRAYSPPPWYPVPDRLGISFTLGSMINVTGNVYFAITPKCVMGGGALHLGLDVGPVSAWLDVALDVFIQFKPFHYMADLKVSVGCAISIDVWFVHVRITASVGAQLHIEGPDPFGGTATVDFYLFSFTIHFGSKPPPPPAAILSAFYDMVHIPGPPPDPNSSATAVDAMLARLKFTLSVGAYPQPIKPIAGGPPPTGPFPSTGADTSWFIKTGNFEFVISLDFALPNANLVSTTTPTSTPILTAGGGNPAAFCSKPMHLSTAITSILTITVYALFPDNPPTSQRVIANGFTGTLILKDVPVALWGKYDTGDDPAVTPRPDSLKDGTTTPTMSLALGVNLVGPPSKFGPSALQDFDPSIAFKASITNSNGGPFNLPETENVSQKSFFAGTPIYPTDTPAKRWEGFHDDWKAAGDVGGHVLGNPSLTDGTLPEGGLLALMTHWLAWDAPPPNGTGGFDSGGGAGTGTGTGAGTIASVERKPWVLDGRVPPDLLGELGVEYPVLPRYGGGIVV